jgi:NAD(P)H-dependent FMN reductase
LHITVVYGTEHRGSTYHIAQEVVRNIRGAETEEIFLPRDLPEFCVGCLKCFTEEKGACAHAAYTAPIREKLLRADLIILTSPVYSFHVSGQMKAFLDHFANMWIVHRPEAGMFRKQGLVIATASGPVYRKTLGEMKDSLDFWGVARTYRIGGAVMQGRWEDVTDGIRDKLLKKAAKTAARIEKRDGRVRPCLRVRKWFAISRMMQKHIRANPPDVAYWERMGWTGRARPWKTSPADPAGSRTGAAAPARKGKSADE